MRHRRCAGCVRLRVLTRTRLERNQSGFESHASKGNATATKAVLTLCAMSVKCNEQQPKRAGGSGRKSNGVAGKEQTMSKDTIYREDAIKAVKSSIEDGWGRISPVDACQNIRCLPSADRPSGEWIDFGLGRGTHIYYCTNCERQIEVPLAQGNSKYGFCPNCGARMKGADDE